MKRWISFTLLLVISFIPKAFGCYFYPYGEDIRFSVFDPQNFKYDRFWMYNYSYNYYYPGDETELNSNITENDVEWQKQCNKKVSLTEIRKAIFEIGIEECNRNSKNLFIQYLFKIKDFETLEYLKFAKEVQKITSTNSDELWEKGQDTKNQLIHRKITFAKRKLKDVKKTIIKKRYYYQIFKLLDYYPNSNKQSIDLYREYLNQFKTQDFIDNWALYYRMNAEKDEVKTNFLAAQVFARGTDNKFNIQWHFNKNIPLEKVLRFAKTNQEKANVYVLYSFKNIEPNLNVIQKVIEVDPTNIGLSFLLLREINKLEDWILTPTYTMFLPVLRPDYWENTNASKLLNRVEVDRKYAQKLLEVVNKLDFGKVENRNFFLLVKSYLEFLTKDYTSAIQTLKPLEGKVTDNGLKRQINIIKALSLIANQKKDKAIIIDEIKPIILNESKNKNFSFLFAIAKELEFLNNNVDAAYLISQIVLDEENYEGTSVFWKSRASKVTLQNDFYSDWYGYIDAELTTDDLQKIVNEMSFKTDAFDKWKKRILRNDPNRVYDLLGIKYMREDNLGKAHFYFSKVSKTHYTNLLFNENPFYKIKDYMNYDVKQKANNYTKAKVISQLMRYLKKANNVKNSRRDINYFLAANCYYNMSYYGNSWMLKRIYWTSNLFSEANMQDENEYFGCGQAKKLYERAFQFTKDEKFKALCAFMIAKCEARKNEYEFLRGKEYLWDANFHELREELNEKSFINFKNNYKSEYLEMTSNCEVFSNYYKKRLRRM